MNPTTPVKTANNTELVSDTTPMHFRNSWSEKFDMSKLKFPNFDVAVNSTPIVNNVDIVKKKIMKSINQKRATEERFN